MFNFSRSFLAEAKLELSMALGNSQYFILVKFWRLWFSSRIGWRPCSTWPGITWRMDLLSRKLSVCFKKFSCWWWVVGMNSRAVIWILKEQNEMFMSSSSRLTHLFNSWGYWGPESLSDFSKVTKLVRTTFSQLTLSYFSQAASFSLLLIYACMHIWM